MLKLVLTVWVLCAAQLHTYSHTVFTLVVGSYWGNRGDSFYSCVSVCPSVCLSVRLSVPSLLRQFSIFLHDFGRAGSSQLRGCTE